MKGRFNLIGTMDKRKKGDLLGNQMVFVTLAQYGTNPDGKVLLTCSLASDAEVDGHIDILIKELEIIRKKAKLKISSDNAKIRAEMHEE